MNIRTRLMKVFAAAALSSTALAGVLFFTMDTAERSAGVQEPLVQMAGICISCNPD